MKRVIILSCIIILTGCLPKKQIYTKPNLTQSEWQQDKSRCVYETTSSTQDVDYSYRTIVGQALNQNIRRNELMDLCLRAKGYYLQNEESPRVNNSLFQHKSYNTVKESSIEVKVPTPIEWGGIVPINVNARDSKQIKEISITIPSNPKGYQESMTVKFIKPQINQFLSTRLRLSKSQNGKILVKITNGEGEEIKKSINVGKVGNPVDFTNESSLYVSFGNNGLGNKVGASKVVYSINKKQIKGLISHPMRPKNHKHPSLLITRMEVFSNTQLVAIVESKNAVSNDPYISISVRSTPKSAKITWEDSQGNFYSAIKD